jgi:serine/threonine protein kinase/WD40 repeat protein
MSAPTDARGPVELLADEFLSRCKRGEKPTIKEYCDRHPTLADEIRDVFEALLMVEDLKPGAGDVSGSFGESVKVDGKRLEQVGDYRILCEIGRGGMGVVFEAEQQALGRRVALKVLPKTIAGNGSAQIRFQREAKAAARMHHTNIVPVFDVGQDGEHLYYAMQLIHGQGLDSVISDLKKLRGQSQVSPFNSEKSIAASLIVGRFEQEKLGDASDPNATGHYEGSPPSSAVLPGQSELSSVGSDRRGYYRSVAHIGLQTGSALSYAHARGIIHRDIKPGNLLLDNTGNVWVTDFGLAKMSDGGMTHTGDILGTIRYMSPERFRGNCDVRADVYALGMTLYEMLALKAAYASEDRLKLIELIRQTEPPSPRTFDARIPLDLETIVMKAIDKEPKRRYQSADEMGEDLQRFVNDEPIKARRIGVVERLTRWCRRNPLPASLLVGIILVFVAGFAGAFWQWREAVLAREDERSQRGRAEMLRQGAETARDDAEKSQAAAQAETYRAVLSEVRALRAGHEPGWRDKALGDLARLAVMPTTRRDLPELRTEAAATLGTPDIRLVARIALHGGALGSFTFSPDGQTLLTADRNTGLDFWDVPRNRHLSSVESLMVAEGLPTHDKVVYLPDGLGLAVGTAQGVVFTDLRGSRTPRAPITQGSSKPTKLSLSANGKRIAVAWTGGAGITVHDTMSGDLIAGFKVANSTFVLSPDGNWLAGRENSDLVLLPVAAGEKRVVLGRQEGTTAVAVSPNGAVLAAAFDHTFAAGSDLTTVLWDVTKREQLGVLRGHRGRVTDVAFSPDGEWIATGSYDYTTRIWEARTGQNVAILHGSAVAVFAVKWSPTGDYLAVSDSLEIFLFKIAGRQRVRQWLTGHQIEQSRLAAHPRLERLATSGFSDLNSWDLSVSHPSPVSLGPNPGNVTCLEYSHDGSLLAVASGEVLIRDSATGKIQARFSGPSPWIYGLAFDPAGGRLASGDIMGNVILWDLATNRPIQQFSTGSQVRSVFFLDAEKGTVSLPQGDSPLFRDQSRRLVTHGRNAVLLFNLESGKVERKVDVAGGSIQRLVADQARGRLLVGLESGAIATLSLEGLAPGPRLEKAHDGSVEWLALSPDGHLLATMGADRRVVLWDAISFETLLRFPLGDGTPTGLTFDSTGRRLVIVKTGEDIELWHLAALHDGLMEVGLAWDQPAPTIVPAAGSAPEGESLRPVVPIIRRPGNIDPAAFEEARRLVQSGVAAFHSGGLTEAIRDLRAASDRLRAFLKVSPNDGRLSSNLGISLGFLGSAQRDSHRPVEALASIQEQRCVLEAMRNPGPVDLYNLACGYAQLSVLLQNATTPPTAAERESLASQAVDALRRSLAAGMKDFAVIDGDHDLDPLRERPDFQKLVAEAKAKAEKK